MNHTPRAAALVILSAAGLLVLWRSLAGEGPAEARERSGVERTAETRPSAGVAAVEGPVLSSRREDRPNAEPSLAPALAPGPPAPAPEHGAARGLRLFGFVLDENGSGVQGARVLANGRSSESRTGGAFEVEWSLEDDEELELDLPLVAVAEGYQPGVVASLADVPSTIDTVGPVEFRLRAGQRELRGRLVDRAGAGCPQWRIALYDPTFVRMPVGAAEPAGDAEGSARRAALLARGGELSAEDLCSDVRSSSLTADDGGFVFGGLRSDRSYRLRTWNEDTLQSFISDEIPPDTTTMTFVIDLESVHPEVHGTVVGLDGRPLSGVKIRLSMLSQVYEVNGELESVESHTGATQITDASGAFHFVDVPHAGAFLRFHGEEVAAQPYRFSADSAVQDLRLVLRRQGRFELQLEDQQPRPDAFEAWDLAGDLVAVKTSGAYEEPARVALPQGEIPTYRTTDDARWLVLYAEGREIARRELALVPGETVSVRF